MRKWMAFALVLVPGIAGADVYRYTADNGTLSYTDDPKQVPSRYQGAVERIPDADLASYARFTRVAKYPELRTWEEPAEVADALPVLVVPAQAQRTFSVHTSRASALELPVEGDEPITVRRGRYQWSDDGYLKSHTIVEQGGRVLAVMEDAR
jgi:hypothetical protein